MLKRFRKPIVYLLAFLLAFPIALFANSNNYAQAADSGYRTADDFDNMAIAGGGYDWSNTPASISNDQYTTANIDSSSFPTDYLKSTDYDFRIPSWATINGIEMTVERSRNVGSGGTVTDNSVKLVKNNVVVGANKADTSTAWTSSDVVVTYGGPNDLWGEAWTPANINSSSFGSVFSAKRTSGGDRTARVDQIRMKVYYSDATAPVIAPHEDVIAEAITPAGAVVDYVAPMATDNYDPESPANCTPASGSTFSLGDTIVTCNITDSSGNAAIATTFKVKVQDTTGPVIDTPTSTPDTTGEETTVSALVTDLVGAVIYVGISVNGSSYNPMTKDGSDYHFYYVLPYDSLNPVTYQIKAIDEFGNETITSPISTITPIDNDKPVITLIGSANLNIEYNSTYVEKGAVWTDNIDGNGSAIVSGDVVNTSVVGAYNVRYNYVDSSGNAADEVVRIVNVVKSTQAPVTNLTVTPGNGKVSLSWLAPLGAVSYNIYYKKKADSDYPSTFIPTTNTNTEIIGLENGVEYDFAVVAIDAFGSMSEKSVVSSAPMIATISTPSVVQAVATTTQEILPQEPATGVVTDNTEEDQDTNKADDSAGKIKGDEEVDTSEEEESVNWTPWIILFILIILAGAATGGYFYWFAGEDEMEEKTKKSNATVTVKEKSKNQIEKKGESQSKSSKKPRRW
jgi:hypothetical protein